MTDDGKRQGGIKSIPMLGNSNVTEEDFNTHPSPSPHYSPERGLHLPNSFMQPRNIPVIEDCMEVLLLGLVGDGIPMTVVK